MSRRLLPIGIQTFRKIRKRDDYYYVMNCNSRYGSAPVLLVLLISLLTIGPCAHAEIYKWTDAEGRTQFSDRPPDEGVVEEVDLGRVNTYQGVSVEEYASAAPTARTDAKQVIMYSTAWCGVCKRAKAFFRERSIGFTELDIEKSDDARRAYDRLHGRGVPLILVGNKRMSGFSATRFLAMYADAD